MINSQQQVRQLFWDSFPEFKPEYRVKKRQNEYPTDVRCAFVFFVNMLHKDGGISEKLVNRVTL